MEPWYRVLGPVEAGPAEAPLRLGGARRRALLAALLLRANQAVPASELVEAVWGLAAPAGAATTLRSHIHRLNAVLQAGDGGKPISAQGGGYAIAVPDELIDARRFRTAVAAAERAVQQGGAGAAHRLLSDALALWRGPALADLADNGFFDGAIAALTQQRLTALEQRLDLDLALGRTAHAVPELEELVASHPLRERFWEQLITALHRVGRQSDALGAFERIRSVLADELGVDPGKRLQALHLAVLRQEPDRAEERAEAVPLPPALLERQGVPFVGRSPELEQLEVAWERAAGGRPQLVVVTGEPGVGKTRLAGQWAQHRHRSGALVLFGRCDEAVAVPFQPFVDGLRQLIDHLPPDRLGSTLGRLPGELSRLVPELDDVLEGLPPPLQSDPETERYRLLDAIQGWLTAPTDRAPLLLVIDDLQWADPPTLFVLRHVLRTRRLRHLLVVATLRDTVASPAQQLVAELRHDDIVTVLPLGGLDAAEVAALMASADLRPEGATAEQEHSLAARVATETGGNPFFALELLRHLHDTGALAASQPEGRAVPDSVRDVVGQRAAALPAQAGQVLRWASVAGLEFHVDLVAAAAGMQPHEVADALVHAEQARLVTTLAGPRLRFAFVHALLRDAVYEAMPGPQRAQMHRRVGEALEELRAPRLDEHVAALAHHFGQAALVGDTTKAVTYALRAGDQALQQLAEDAAIHHYRHALALLEEGDAPIDPVAHCDLLTALGEALNRAGDAGHREVLFAAAAIADQLHDGPRLARAVLVDSRLQPTMHGEVDSARTALIERAIATLGASDAALRAQLLAALAAELLYSGDVERCRALCDEAVELAESSNDTTALVRVLCLQDIAVQDPSLLERRQARTAQLIQLAEGLDDPFLRFSAWHRRCVTCLDSGWLDEARRCGEVLAAIESSHSQPLLRWFVARHRTLLATVEGDFDTAEAMSAIALQEGAAAEQPDALLFYGTQLMWLRHLQGRSAEVLEASEHVVSSAPALKVAAAGLVGMYLQAGRELDAARLFTELTAAPLAEHPRDATWMALMVLLAESAADLGDRRAAADLYDVLAPFVDRCATLGGGLILFGPVAHYLGRLAATLQRPEEARRLIAQAVAMARDLRVPPLLARSLTEQTKIDRASVDGS